MQCFKLKRMVLNTPQFASFLTQGGQPLEKAHVTLIYSTTPVDLSLPVFTPDTGTLTLDDVAFTPTCFGPPDARVWVLAFDHPILQARHQALLRFGARSDFFPFHPHITVGPNPIPTTAFRAPLVLGPEQRKLL